MTKPMLASLIAVNIVLGSAFFALQRLTFETSQSSASINDAELYIVDGDLERMFAGPVIERMSYIQALYAAAMATSLDMKFVSDSNGTKVLSLNGKADDGKKWQFYLNGQPIDGSKLDSYQIHSRDLLKAAYE